MENTVKELRSHQLKIRQLLGIKTIPVRDESRAEKLSVVTLKNDYEPAGYTTYAFVKVSGKPF